MKIYRLTAVMMMVLLCFSSGLVFAQEVPLEPTVNRPPLVECVEGQNAPCSEVVDQVSDIVGVWRSYGEGATVMDFIVYGEEGGFGTTLDPRAEPVLTGSITFEDGVAFIAANAGGTVPAECVAPGIYKMRLICMGDQPVALTYRPVSRDNCIERATDFSEPMLSYAGPSEVLPNLNADVDTLAQPLVPCPAEVIDDAQAYPCDVVATQSKDIVGIWTQYLVPPLTGAAFIRYNEDGSWVFAGTAEDTAAVSTSYDNGTVRFDQALATFTEAGGCPPGEYYLRVIQWGHQPVALSYREVNDDGCAVRRSAWTDPMIWIKGV